MRTWLMERDLRGKKVGGAGEEGPVPRVVALRNGGGEGSRIARTVRWFTLDCGYFLVGIAGELKKSGKKNDKHNFREKIGGVLKGI